MQLLELVDGLAQRIVGDAAHCEIVDMQIDSRQVSAGCLFVARVGWYDDGHRYIASALAKGAAAIAVSREDAVPQNPPVPFVVVTDENAFLPDASVRLFGDPTAELGVIGITGTNGKTTTAMLVCQLLDAIGEPYALISTVHYRVAGEVLPAPNTTPDALVVQRIARRAVDAGARFLVMEVSSHGIQLGRVRGTRFRAVGFTNLTSEHLDFHGSVDAYRDTKLRLFTEILETSGGETAAVVNVDSTEGETFAARSLATRTMRTSGHRSTDVDVSVVTSGEGFGAVCITAAKSRVATKTQLLGGFNRENLSVALGLVQAATSCSWEPLLASVPLLGSAPGRLERAAASRTNEPDIFVDYAHTSDAVRTVLEATREDIGEGRLVAVIGCGGDRDSTKRPAMARAAAEIADLAIFTTDNPRTESAEAILSEMTQGLQPSPSWRVVRDRTEAIAEAIAESGAGTVVLLGKGHETYQEFNGVRYAFDDREEARRAVASWRWGIERDEVPLLSGWHVNRVAEAIGGVVRAEGAGAPYRRFTTDSRSVDDGDIFVALRGERFDGHAYVSRAAEAGAALVVVEDESVRVADGCGVIVVPDTGEAILKLSRSLIEERRARHHPVKVIAITGSNGKTTVKELTAALSEAERPGTTLKTRGNFNNRIGLPLSVAPMTDSHETVVLEMGANHAGEIAELVRYVEPDVAVLTSIGEAHTEGFGSLDGVRRAKREIFSGTRLQLAVLPQSEWSRDEAFWQPEADGRVISFGAAGAEFRATRDTPSAQVSLRYGSLDGEVRGTSLDVSVDMPVPGVHQAGNLACAFLSASWQTEARAFRWLDSETVNDALQGFSLPGGRWRTHRVAGRLLIDDAYNANPTSMRVALDAVAESDAPVWFVAGTMRELGGDESARRTAHAELGRYAAARVERVISVGDYADAVKEGADGDGVAFETNQQVVDFLEREAPEGTVILLKGSRSARLEDVCAGLCERWGGD